MRILKTIFIFLILAWLSISSYLTYTHYTNTAVFCEIPTEKKTDIKVFKIENVKKQSSCDKVLQSSYSEIFGIPMAVLGIIFYLGILATFLLVLFNKIKKEILVLFTFIWVCFSAYFSYLQYFVIHWFCYYCFSSAIITVLLFIFSLIFKFRKW